MQIIEYFEDERKEHWKKEMLASDWGSAFFLVELLDDRDKFKELLGEETKVYLLVDGERLVTFATLSHQDCIRDESMYPWIGFLFTFPDYRGCRYSEKVICHAEEQARNNGHSKTYIATDHIGLYEKYGYVYMETRVDYWGDETRIYVKEL